MINAILIDDERPSLRELEFLLKEYSELNIIGLFTNPFEALENIRQLKPQVVFLDINMPQLRGIDAASKILDDSPKTNIIFVTAFDQYAIEAFELHALDYILKPISKSRFRKTIERLISNNPVHQQVNSKKLQIKCFGRFQVNWDNQDPIKWRAEKTKELFAFLLLNHGRNMSKDELLDKLWTEDDPEKAIRQLYNGIYYIRKAIEGYGIDRELININSNYSIQLGTVDYDVENFCNKFNNSRNESLEELKEIEALYVEDYLHGDDYTWSNIERERLSKMYYQCLIKLSDKYIERRQWDDAEDTLLKAYYQNPYEETSTEKLMELYYITGDRHKAIKHFHSFSCLMKNELDVNPNEKLQKLYKSIQRTL